MMQLELKVLSAISYLCKEAELLLSRLEEIVNLQTGRAIQKGVVLSIDLFNISRGGKMNK